MRVIHGRSCPKISVRFQINSSRLCERSVNLPLEFITINLSESINTALNAVSDGLVRVFKDNMELTEFDKDIEVSEGDVFTFVKLTMLSGRMWESRFLNGGYF